MGNDRYSLGNLETTFAEHSKKFVEEREVWKKNFEENSPGEEYKFDDFNICDAFLTMVKELRSLKATMKE